MMLEHYQQTKNLLVSYSPKKLGFFQFSERSSPHIPPTGCS
jgi:hypothetical protein